MVDFSISDESRMLLETVRRFVRTELIPLELGVEESGCVSSDLSRTLLARSKALGLYAMNMSVEAGGPGLDTVDVCLMEEECGWTSDALIRHSFGAVPSGLEACVGAQRERFLFPAVRGDIVVGFAMTEPGAGSDAAGISTTARAIGERFLLNGSKHFISDGDRADVFIVTAITDPDRGKKGISTFLIDRKTQGVTIGPVQHMMGLRGINHCPVYFNEVEVTPDMMLGPRGDGLRVALGTSNRVRLGNVGARACGTASRLLQLSVDYAKERKQFGAAIGTFQLIQGMLAEMTTDIYATRMMVLNAAWDLDRGVDARTKVSMVKLQASEMLGRVADRAVQIFGGSGYCRDLPIERCYRDARVQRIFDGTSEIHKVAIARSVLAEGLPW